MTLLLYKANRLLIRKLKIKMKKFIGMLAILAMPILVFAHSNEPTDKGSNTENKLTKEEKILKARLVTDRREAVTVEDIMELPVICKVLVYDLSGNLVKTLEGDFDETEIPQGAFRLMTDGTTGIYLLE